jgi:peptide chain release factor 2
LSFGGIFDVDNKAERLVEVNQTLEDPKIWDDPKQAQALGKEKKLLDGVVGTINFLTDNITSSQELFDMAKEEGANCVECLGRTI